MMKLEESGANEYIELAQDFQGAGWNTVHFDMSTVTSSSLAKPRCRVGWNCRLQKASIFY